MILMGERDEQWRFCISVFLCGAALYAASVFMPGAMDAAQFGQIVYDVDAEIWALGLMCGSAMSAYGIHINGRWRMSPLLRVNGYLILLGLFAVLVYSAATAEYGLVIVAFGAFFFLPVIGRYLLINTLDLWRRVKVES